MCSYALKVNKIITKEKKLIQLLKESSVSMHCQPPNNPDAYKYGERDSYSPWKKTKSGCNCVCVDVSVWVWVCGMRE